MCISHAITARVFCRCQHCTRVTDCNFCGVKMATISTPEQSASSASSLDACARHFSDHDFSHLTRRPAIAATGAQLLLVASALDFYAIRRRWPTAIELARWAGVDFPVVWKDLRCLARLGCVSWERTVRVLRQPTGLFFAVSS